MAAFLRYLLSFFNSSRRCRRPSFFSTIPSTISTRSLHSIVPDSSSLLDMVGCPKVPASRSLEYSSRFPMQQFYTIPRSVHEYVHTSVARVASKDIGHYATQCIVTLTHVGRLSVIHFGACEFFLEPPLPVFAANAGIGTKSPPAVN